MGEKVELFEKAYAEYIGSKYAVMVNSGSSANLLMVAAMSLRQGVGTVIVPAVSWSTSYAPFQQYGWKLKFVDIDRDTLNYDMNQLKAAYTGDELILAVNLLGNPNDFREFPSMSILEDNCEAMGAEYANMRTGSFGLMGSHSTFFSHHMCTMEGGIVTTDDDYFYEMLLSLRSHGWTRHLPDDNILKQEKSAYRFIYPGYNVRPIEMMGALGLTQLKKLPGFIEQRRKNAEEFPLWEQTTPEWGKSSCFCFPIISSNIDQIKDYFDEVGVEHRPIMSNFVKSPAIEYFNYEIHGELDSAAWVEENGIYIGNSHEIIDWSFLDSQLFDGLKK